MSHWHVQQGLTGYGPDMSEDSADFELGELATVIHEELLRCVEDAFTQILVARDGNDKDEMVQWWDVWRRIDDLAPAFDPARAQAPLYRNNKPGWLATVRELAEVHFPLFLDPYCTRRLYVWECDADHGVSQ